jgi:hypothetical protein
MVRHEFVVSTGCARDDASVTLGGRASRVSL